MTHSRLIVAAALSFGLVAVGAGAAVGAAERGHSSSRALFAGEVLLPGKSVHTDITVPVAHVPIRPYLEISAVHQRCAGPNCDTETPALADILQLSATDGAGQTWTGTFAAAQKRIALPGGTIAAGQRRSYYLTLSLPARADNSYEGLAVSGHFSWGGIDASGRVVSSTSDQVGQLPFTGLDVIALLLAAGCLLGVGGTLVETARQVQTARRRRRRD
jgi:hypothetical protein